MKKIGFIGLGHMGRALLENLLLSESIHPQDVVIYNRTPNKAEDIKYIHPLITIAATVEDLYQNVDTIISSVTAMAQKPILESIARENIHFISVSNGLTLKEMKKVYGGRITRIMPTVSMGGYTLITDESRDLEALFSKVSTPLFIKFKLFNNTFFNY
jgi:pyrroline-5-carboxylate reductase